jgi:hypothetical protein
MPNSKQLNWLFDDCIPHTVSSPSSEPKPTTQPTAKIKKPVMKPACEYKLVPVSTISHELYSDYRRKIIARLRAAKNPRDCSTHEPDLKPFT